MVYGLSIWLERCCYGYCAFDWAFFSPSSLGFVEFVGADSSEMYAIGMIELTSSHNLDHQTSYIKQFAQSKGWIGETL